MHPASAAPCAVHAAEPGSDHDRKTPGMPAARRLRYASAPLKWAADGPELILSNHCIKHAVLAERRGTSPPRRLRHRHGAGDPDNHRCPRPKSDGSPAIPPTLFLVRLQSSVCSSACLASAAVKSPPDGAPPPGVGQHHQRPRKTRARDADCGSPRKVFARQIVSAATEDVDGGSGSRRRR